MSTGAGGPESHVRRLRCGLLVVPEETLRAAVAGLEGASSWCRPVMNHRLWGQRETFAACSWLFSFLP